MKALSCTTAGVLLALCPVVPAAAVDVVNGDGRDYEVTVTENGVASRFTLFSGGDEEDVCGACTVSIDGVGSIEASGKETIVVSGGRLSKKTG